MGELVDLMQRLRRQGSQEQPVEPLRIAWHVEPDKPHRRHYRISGLTRIAVLDAIDVRNRLAERFNGLASWSPVFRIGNEFRAEGLLVLPEETEKPNA